MDVTTISEAPWRVYPALALVLGGLALLAKGLCSASPEARGCCETEMPWGGCAAFAWPSWDSPRGHRCRLGRPGLWLFVASAGILGEEMLETSVIIETLKRHPHGWRPEGRVGTRRRVPRSSLLPSERV